MTDNFIINLLLTPFSWLYGLGVSIRNKLFDWKMLPVEEFSVPVISIGNLAVGGTGKTPHIEYLLNLLLQSHKVAVLSRGYKRKTSGFILADNQADSSTIGDEPFQLFHKFPQAIIAVDADRRRGIRNLLTMPKEKRPEIILLDDAFQHRFVRPSLSILLTDSHRLFSSDKLLPAGRMREPAKNKKRAQIIVVTKCSPTLTSTELQIITEKIKPNAQQKLFFSFYEYNDLRPIFSGNKPIHLNEIKDEQYDVLLLAGIAAPESLIAFLKNFVVNLEILLFPDHHYFSEKDFNKLNEKFSLLKNQKKIIITTEKDAARILNNDFFPKNLKPSIYYLPITVGFYPNNELSFTKIITDHVGNFKRNRILA